MTSRFFYSASVDGFFDSVLQKRFDAAGTWPDDAVPVSADVAEKFRAAPPVGKKRGATSEGHPCWIDIDIDTRRAQAINWLDATADRVRAADRSVGQYLDAEYQLVAQALIEYRSSTGGEVPDAIRSYAAAEGLTVEDAAEQIAEAAARAEDLLQAVRRIRLAGKAAIRDADDDADMMETARPFIDQLEALARIDK